MIGKRGKLKIEKGYEEDIVLDVLRLLVSLQELLHLKLHVLNNVLK